MSVHLSPEIQASYVDGSTFADIEFPNPLHNCTWGTKPRTEVTVRKETLSEISAGNLSPFITIKCT